MTPEPLTELRYVSVRDPREGRSDFCWYGGSALPVVIRCLSFVFFSSSWGVSPLPPHIQAHTFVTQPQGPCPMHQSTAGLTLAGLPATMMAECWQVLSIHTPASSIRKPALMARGSVAHGTEVSFVARQESGKFEG